MEIRLWQKNTCALDEADPAFNPTEEPACVVALPRKHQRNNRSSVINEDSPLTKYLSTGGSQRIHLALHIRDLTPCAQLRQHTEKKCRILPYEMQGEARSAAGQRVQSSKQTQDQFADNPAGMTT